jgi:hypothetical protein
LKNSDFHFKNMKNCKIRQQNYHILINIVKETQKSEKYNEKVRQKSTTEIFVVPKFVVPRVVPVRQLAVSASYFLVHFALKVQRVVRQLAGKKFSTCGYDNLCPALK